MPVPDSAEVAVPAAATAVQAEGTAGGRPRKRLPNLSWKRLTQSLTSAKNVHRGWVPCIANPWRHNPARKPRGPSTALCSTPVCASSPSSFSASMVPQPCVIPASTDLAEHLVPGCNDPNSKDHWSVNYVLIWIRASDVSTRITRASYLYVGTKVKKKNKDAIDKFHLDATDEDRRVFRENAKFYVAKKSLKKFIWTRNFMSFIQHRHETLDQVEECKRNGNAMPWLTGWAPIEESFTAISTIHRIILAKIRWNRCLVNLTPNSMVCTCASSADRFSAIA